MKSKKRSASSRRWLKEHFSDPYVKQAKKQGLRSRAVFKLEELQERDRLLKQGMTVVDLGAAPGGWSSYAVQQVTDKGRVVACDLLEMDPIANVQFIQGDFREESVLNALLDAIGEGGVDVILSDMAPNTSGINAVDQPRSMYLVELALEMCSQVLNKNGAFIVKAFHGEGFDAYLMSVRKKFKTVKIRKPDSSRARSREVYIVASGFKL